MANALYDFGRESFLGGNLDWDTQLIKIILIDDADYTKNLATDQDLVDVPAAARVATSGGLTSKTITDGVADAADETWSAVSGDVSEEIVGYFDSTVEATSLLIFNIDTATGLPITPNSGDITVQWDSGSNRIFKL